MNIMDKINKEHCRDDLPDFKTGDTVRVHVRVVEGSTERIQVFTGTVIARKKGGINSMFTVRRVAFGQGTERTFPLNSPRIAKIEVEREGRVRRSKLYYLRDRVGKAARVREKRRS